MKSLKVFTEGKESEAHKKAVAQGLQYRGFGYWADPNSGKIVARSSGDDLKPITKEGEDEEKEAPEEVKGGASSYDDMAAAGAAGEVQMGAVKPGEEKARKDVEWEAGPDGSTDVGTDKNEVEDDAFVDKDEDNNDWVAGPDGRTTPTSLSTPSKRQLKVRRLLRRLPKRKVGVLTVMVSGLILLTHLLPRR